MSRSVWFAVAFAILSAAGAHAEVTRAEVKTRADLGAPGYEKVRKSADGLVQKRYLLADDASRAMQCAGDTWDLVVRDAGTQR